MLRYGKFPYGIGNHLSFEVNLPIENRGDPDTILAAVEKSVISGVTSFA